MSDELNPISPQEARDLYLDARQDDAADWTIRSHESRLRAFIEWCREEEIGNLNTLNGRDLYHYRVWRREGNYSEGKVDELAPKTLETALSTIRRFLRFCGEIEAVPEDLYLKVPLPDLSSDDEVSDSKIVPERVPPILEYLERYEYASRDHVIVLLMWHCGARISGLRTIDLRDLDLEDSQPGIEFINRPSTDTRLKNGDNSERFNRISDRTATVIRDYIEGPRVDVTDDFGRKPLFTTVHGRIARGTIRSALYKMTRPCWIGEECPHDKDPQTCEWATYDQASKCPSARSPHDVRKARVTKYRNDGVHRGVVSDRLDASEKILDKHYDRASRREKANRRWREINR